MRDFPEIQSEKAARKKKNISLVEEAGFSAHAVISFPFQGSCFLSEMKFFHKNTEIFH